MLLAVLVLVAVQGAWLQGAVRAEDPDWWRHTIVYQIYPRSFQDSNGDGIGDLRGILSRLSYFEYLHVDTLWLSPIYTSPFKDHGYDVANFTDIDPVFGTLADFDELIKGVHALGMKLMMDFIPNHTSDDHPWFVASRQDRDNPYSSYYCWSDGRRGQDGSHQPPNNWRSIFGGSAWEWVAERQQYYLHQFIPGQPDLNYRHPAVRHSMLGVLQFWLAHGVDGFRVDAIHTLFEVEDVSLDEPPSNTPGVLEDQHEFLLHPHTLHQPDIHHVTREWRRLLDQHWQKSGKTVFMVMEIYDDTLVESMKYYHSGGDMPFNFNFIYINTTCGGSCVRRLIDAWLDNMPPGAWPNFVLGNHDNKRITTRKGTAYVDALNMLLLTLPGTPTTYYGEELGMRDISVTYEATQDPFGRRMGPERYTKFSRDPARAPMQWSSEKNAGFSEGSNTWLPVHPGHSTVNVRNQQLSHGRASHLQVYREVAALRREKAFQGNANISYVVVNENILSYIRHSTGTPVYLVALNLGNVTSTDDYTLAMDTDIYTTGMVEVASVELEEVINDIVVDLEAVTLTPGQSLIMKLQQTGQDTTDNLLSKRTDDMMAKEEL